MTNRLTMRDEYGNADIIALSDVMPELYAELSFSETNALTDALNKLAAYEDAEEQGLLARLPCALGKKVFLIERQKVYECWVAKYLLGYDGVELFSVFGEEYPPTTKRIKWLGKTVFLTREEAEAALKAEGADNGTD